LHLYEVLYGGQSLGGTLIHLKFDPAAFNSSRCSKL